MESTWRNSPAWYPNQELNKFMPTFAPRVHQEMGSGIWTLEQLSTTRTKGAIYGNFQPANQVLHVANGHQLQVKGVGTMKFKLPNGGKMILSDVRYAPDLCVNLLSDGLFDDQGVNMKRENGVMTYSYMGKDVFTANKSRRGLWPINAEAIRPPDAMTVSQTLEDYQIEWHRRMGHIGSRSLHQLASADVVHGNVVSGANKFECSTCSACKITRRPFPASKKPKEKHPLDKIHVDLLEMKRASRNGHQYALVITDDHSKAKFAFPLKRKSDAVIDFKKWMVYAERMADRKLKCIRTDNAKELTEGGMKALIDDLGIKYPRILPIRT